MLICSCSYYYHHSQSVSQLWSVSPTSLRSTIYLFIKNRPWIRDQLSNYCSVSNLSLISKLIEHVVKSLLTEHLSSPLAVSGRCLSTWQMTAASCPTAAVNWRSDLRGAANTQHYGDRTFAAAGPRLWNSLPVQLCNPEITYTDCSNDSWTDTFFVKHEHGVLWLLICGALEKHLLTYLLTFHPPDWLHRLQLFFVFLGHVGFNYGIVY